MSRKCTTRHKAGKSQLGALAAQVTATTSLALKACAQSTTPWLQFALWTEMIISVIQKSNLALKRNASNSLVIQNAKIKNIA